MPIRFERGALLNRSRAERTCAFLTWKLPDTSYAASSVST